MRLRIFVILLLIVSAAQAQPVFETYTPANGLVDAKVSKLAQDPWGRIVFITREGFSLFDGQRFQNYLEVGGIPVGIVQDAIRFSDGSYFIIPFNGSAIRLYRDHAERDTALLKGSFEISNVISMGKDEYVLVTNPGLFLLKRNEIIPLINTSTRFPDRLTNLPQSARFGRRLLLHNNLIAGKDSLLLYDIDKKAILAKIQSPPVTGIYNFPDELIFVATPDAVLEPVYSPENGLRLQKPDFYQLLPAGFRVDYMSADDLSNMYFVDIKRGVFSIIQARGQTHFYSFAEGLMRGVSSVFRDRENNIWFLAYGKGVQKMVQSAYQPLTQLGGKPFNTGSFMYPLPGNSVYINGRTAQFITEGDISFEIPGGIGKSLTSFFYWNNDFWKFMNTGLVRSLHNREILINPRDTVQINDSFFGKPVTDRKGNLVISGKIIYVFTRDGKVFSRPASYYLDKVAFDESNRYWAFDRGGKVEMYELTDTGLVKRRSEIPEGISYTFRCAEYTGNGNFIAGTRDRGVLWFNTNGKIRLTGHTTREKGLSNNFVLNLQRILNGDIAVGTASGLDLLRIHETDTTIQHLSAGIGNFEPVLQITADSSGYVYALSELTNQVFRYDSRAFETLPPPAGVWFSSMLCNDSPFDSTRHSFSYRQNHFLFRVSAPSFMDNKGILFTGTLQSDNLNETFSNTTGDIVLNNLEPGHYKLDVKVGYPGDLYPEQFLHYEFLIHPPFWKTRTFYISILLLVGLLIFFFTRVYYQQQLHRREAQLEKEQAIEKERTRIATDMHDDFGASLSRIKFLSEKMQLEQKSGQPAKEDLGKISRYSDEMAEKMNEIVWALNRKYDTLGDLVSFSRAWSSEYLEAHGIELEFSEDFTDIRLNGEIRRNLFLVLKECLHNTVKHSGAGKVQIRFSLEEELRLHISDNGRGINWEQIRPFANGLENIRKRVESIGGLLKYGEAPGTHLLITVPVKN